MKARIRKLYLWFITLFKLKEMNTGIYKQVETAQKEVIEELRRSFSEYVEWNERQGFKKEEESLPIKYLYRGGNFGHDYTTFMFAGVNYRVESQILVTSTALCFNLYREKRVRLGLQRIEIPEMRLLVTIIPEAQKNKEYYFPIRDFKFSDLVKEYAPAFWLFLSNEEEKMLASYQIKTV